ncbi:protein arginine methyltransferase NDUFAF7, mitochondrial isoform X3 [Stigmatopora argus]
MRGLLAANTKQLVRSIHSVAAPWRSTAVGRRDSSCSSGEENAMLRHLTSKIKATGPISVAEYMREALTNPVMGYYVKKNMLGADGDFITSPEISQIFGELLGVWAISEWMAAGRPDGLQLVELGPGKGSLAADVLRVFAQLRSVLSAASVSLHLVEVSPLLSGLQAQTLLGTDQEQIRDDAPVYKSGRTQAGTPVSWYRRLDDVPPGFGVFLAHEFFDALPIHKFQRTERGWREVMVDVDPDASGRLRLALAPAPTMASSTLVQVSLPTKLATTWKSAPRAESSSSSWRDGSPGTAGRRSSPTTDTTAPRRIPFGPSKVTASTTRWRLPAAPTSRPTWTLVTFGGWRNRWRPAWDRWLRGPF